jgi:hypothetical protein
MPLEHSFAESESAGGSAKIVHTLENWYAWIKMERIDRT